LIYILIYYRLLKRKSMESVDLDMDDIFDEEEVPSVGPLPDLPQDGEGLDNTQHGQEEEGKGKQNNYVCLLSPD
jgi:hypothetical protein